MSREYVFQTLKQHTMSHAKIGHILANDYRGHGVLGDNGRWSLVRTPLVSWGV